MDKPSQPGSKSSGSFVSIGDFLSTRKAASGFKQAESEVGKKDAAKPKATPPPQIELERTGPHISRLTLRCGCGDVHVIELRLGAESSDPE